MWVARTTRWFFDRPYASGPLSLCFVMSFAYLTMWASGMPDAFRPVPLFLGWATVWFPSQSVKRWGLKRRKAKETSRETV